MKNIISILLLLCTAFPLLSSAQSANDLALKDWERAKAYTKEYLDAMPDEGYAFKPTKEMRSFAQQMLHIAEVNYNMAATAAGSTSPVKFGDLEKSTDQSKAATTKSVMDSYDFAINALKGLQPDKMNETVKIFNQDMSRTTGFMKAFEHQTHHRGQTTVYLRLKGVTPPGEKLF